MGKIQLIAETPRAGKWNHRFIVAPTGDLSDSEVAKVVAAARFTPQGEDYLAVSVKTAQSASGRTGDEILVLTGIAVNKLSDTQRHQIMVQLTQRLAELAVLVTEKIDWEQEGKTLLLKCVELANWEKDFKELPIAKKVKPPTEKLLPRKWTPGQLKLAGGVIGILLVLTIVWMWHGKEEDKPVVSQVNTEKTGTPITASENSSSPIKQPEEEKPEQSTKEAQKTAIESFQDKLKKQKFEECQWKAPSKCEEKREKPAAVSFICNISNVDDPKLDQWINGACDVLQSEGTEIDRHINYCLENNKAMKLVIDFFLQEFSTNKEILCPTTNPQ